MSYITNSDIQAWIGAQAYIQLTDDAGTGSADTAKVDEARLGAEGEADSYLATRYAVPVDLGGESQVAAVLRNFVLDLASYRLHSRRPPVPGDVVRRREEAITWFSRLAGGLVQLPSAAAVRENTTLGVIGDAGGSPRLMTRDSLRDL